MAQLPANERLPFPCISKSELDSAANQLSELLRTDQDFMRRALSAGRRLAALPAYDINAAAEISIADGLVSRMLSQPRRFRLPSDHHCEVFAYMVVHLLPRLSPEEGVFLLGKIKSGLDDTRHFDSIFFELLVGYQYHCHGCEVDFRDLKTSAENQKNYDFDVTKGSHSYSAEIKTVGYRIGQPYRLDAVRSELLRLLNYLKSDPRWLDFRAEVTLEGERKAAAGVLAISMGHCIAELQDGKSSATTSHFSVKVINGDSEAFVRTLRAYSSNQMNALSTPYNLFLDGRSPRTQGFLGFKTRLDWRFTQSVAKVIKDAEDQLLSQRKQALWVRVMGLTAGKADPQTALTQLLQVDHQIADAALELWRRLCAKQRGELVCIHLVGTTQYEELPGDLVQINMNAAMFAPTKASNDAMRQYFAELINPEIASPLTRRSLRSATR